MERLTYKAPDSEMVWFKDKERLFEPCEMSVHQSRLAIARLAAYEDAEEQGLLLRLPCKVGDTVWVVTSPFNVFDDIEYDEDMKDEVYEAFISSVTFYKDNEQYRIYAKATNQFIGAYFRECDFGKTVFLTRAEAEAKLTEERCGMKREEAIKLLNDIHSQCCDTANILCTPDADKRCDALQMAITALQNQPDWIPVSDRLPEKSGSYLT